jgi:thiol:disulfide interchange protein DsbD
MSNLKVFFVLLFLIPVLLFAQNSVHWTWNYDSRESLIRFIVELDEGWHIYSQHIQNDIGPIPTQFNFDTVPGIEFLGDVNESASLNKYDENFGVMLDFFEKRAEFTQRINGTKGSVKGVVTYMACNESLCLPPVELPFLISLDKN